MRKLIGTLGVVGALIAAPAAHAVLVTAWTYDVTLNWTGATFEPGDGGGVPFGTGSQTQDANLISWGATGGDHTAVGAAPGDARSALEITNDPANGTVFTDGAAAPTNTVTHFNNAISSSFDTLDTASATTTLTLTPQVPPGDPRDTVSRDFTVQFKETLNSEPCGFESNTICDDIFTIVLGDLDFSFKFDHFLYTVTIVELSGNLGPLSAAQCATAGAPAGCVGIITDENATTPVNFAILITSAVPEPGVLALLGIGLVGLGAIRRRKNA